MMIPAMLSAMPYRKEEYSAPHPARAPRPQALVRPRGVAGAMIGHRRGGCSPACSAFQVPGAELERAPAAVIL